MPLQELCAKREKGGNQIRVPRAMRYEISTVTKYRIRGERDWYEGEMKNISTSGVLIGAAFSLPMETVIEMRFSLPVHFDGRHMRRGGVVPGLSR